MTANLGALVAQAWVDANEKYQALEGDPFRWPPVFHEGIRRGTWRGYAYVKMWNFRTGETEWRKL